MHTFFCPNCGKRFDRDESLAGMKARCKDCQHVFVIPATGGGRPANTARSHPKPSPARSARPAADVPVDDPYGFDEVASVSPARDRYPEAGEESDLLPPMRRPGTVRRKPGRRNGEEFAWVGPVAVIGIGLEAILLALFVFFTLAKLSTAATVIEWIIRIVYTGMLVTGCIVFCVVPFTEGVLHGVLCLIVPFYSLYYVVTRWESMRRPFSLLLSVAVMPIAVVLFGSAIQAARQAALRAQLKQQAPAAEFAVRVDPAPSSSPPSPAPAGGITLELSLPGGVDPQAALVMGRKIGYRVALISKELNPGGFQSTVGRRGNLLTFTITPLRDPQAFAERINFGTVTAIRGGNINVTVSPESAAQLPDRPPNSLRPDSSSPPGPRPPGPRHFPRRPPIGRPR
jgi:hypothetical protein